MKSGCPELARSDLSFGRPHIIHQATGDLYVVMRGEVFGGQHDPFDAWFVDPADGIVFLQRPHGPQTVAELEEHHAEREQRTAPIPARGHR